MSARSHDSDLESDPAVAVLEDNDTDEDDDYVSVAEQPPAPRDSGLSPMDSISPFDPYQPGVDSPDTEDRRPSSPTRSVSPPPAPSPLFVPEGRPSMVEEQGSLSRSRSEQSVTPSARAANTRNNRLSGFFTGLRPRQPPLPRRPSSATHTPPARHVSTAAEPLPPSLPAPSLDDLGLSLNVITPSLSPSHFATPPTSGAFMKPHHLLLCHSQGLDIVPLVGPPAIASYALIRRVPFKSVLVMEERGVLVAIAGRRDGVRVYALEEIRKAVEWRMDVEIQREREKMQREEGKSRRSIADIKGKAIPQKPGVYAVTLPTPTNCNPRSTTVRAPPPPSTAPPRYTATPPSSTPPPVVSAPPRGSSLSVSRRPPPERGNLLQKHVLPRKEGVQDIEEKSDWIDGASDEEALIAAGPSGSAALDERTSTIIPTRSGVQSPEPGDDPDVGIMGEPLDSPVVPGSSSPTTRRHRPTSLQLESSNFTENNAPPAAPTPPPPTVFSLQRAMLRGAGPLPPPSSPPTRQNEAITFAQALFESRLPNPPSPLQGLSAGSVHRSNEEGDESHSDNPHIPARRPSLPNGSPLGRHQRRWSIRGSNQPTSSASLDLPRTRHVSARSSNPSFLASPQSNGGVGPRSAPPPRPSRSPSVPSTPSRQFTPLSRNVSNPAPNVSMPPSRLTTPHRFFPKLLAAAFRSTEKKMTGARAEADRASDKVPPIPSHFISSTSPPPKLEYVKLPGTKNALMIKAVETPKKSFLAILCGDTGEKVELFAGTYRTALGLSRTFILPDSPRSLELQLQGDDLVELFLMFAQNVFGLEPATVRVREVRIGRAERRAARRRAERGPGTAEAVLRRDGLASLGGEQAVNVITTVVSVANSAPHARPSGTSSTGGRRTVPAAAPSAGDQPSTSARTTGRSRSPLAVADSATKGVNIFGHEYIIPPTYLSFVDYQKRYEKPWRIEQPDSGPPGRYDDSPLVPEKPVRWVYKDPKGVLQEFVTLRALQAASSDPENPFVPDKADPVLVTGVKPKPSQVEPAIPASSPQAQPWVPVPDVLLPPTSLLVQPKHFGHSTAIVDSRGRSVLKGRLTWRPDRQSELDPGLVKLGDVKRLEAFDTKGHRAVVVALRQGGIEAVDLSDAVLQPGDESRTSIPLFVSPSNSTGRRLNFVWRLGTPVEDVSSTISPFGISPRKETSLARSATSAAGKRGSAKRSETPKDSDDPAATAPIDEIIFLGRNQDRVYVCERNAHSFRILRLSATS
ncbi:hypothetical protein BS47DRAFT_1341734 [Hydnum rufescens UP504]|uniref:Uncharacterized protein n=1 Tax=Hydnum rufescens UP504 TaxID=1448309 RepID=A0A9P6B155_9AGAM|nr:hypothetical protein BS47DRAFT_1341734 [Hydnum rufescens UP504]